MVPAAAMQVQGRGHSPALALIAGLLIPGAGQAYNGQPVKGAFLLFTTPLVLPWIYSVIDAPLRASRIRREGGRFSRGGLYWILLQAWLFANTIAFTLLVLTVTGVLT